MRFLLPPRLIIVLLPILLLGLAACGNAPTPDVAIKNGHVQAPLGGRDVTLGGFEIEAIGADIKIISAQSQSTAKIELHTMTNADGVMQMRRLEDGITVPAGETLVLGRGGPHLMMFGLDGALGAGDTVGLTIAYEQSGKAQPPITVSAKIMPLGEDPADLHSGHGS